MSIYLGRPKELEINDPDFDALAGATVKPVEQDEDNDEEYSEEKMKMDMETCREESRKANQLADDILNDMDSMDFLKIPTNLSRRKSLSCGDEMDLLGIFFLISHDWRSPDTNIYIEPIFLEFFSWYPQAQGDPVQVEFLVFSRGTFQSYVAYLCPQDN